MEQREILEMSHQTTLGTSPLRKEDLRLITGKDTYVSNMKRHGMLYMAILRSPYAHARIRSIDSSEAKSHQGVVSIFEGEDVRPYPCYWYSQADGMKRATCYPLALEKVRYVGEPVVALVADSPENAKDAIEKISVEYDPLQAITSASDGLKDRAPLIYEEWGDNIAMRYEIKGGDVEKTFANADLVFEETLSIHRHSPVPMEPRAYLAEYDSSSSFITLWATTQNPHLIRTIISATIGHPESKIRVVEPDVGGAFGGKMPSYPEEFLVCIFAKRLARPVKYVEERSESFVAMHQAREQSHHVKIAVSKDGMIQAIDDKIVGDLGVSFPTTGPASLATAARFIPSIYNLQAYRASIIGVATNKPPYGAFRGFGKDASNFIIERIMNIVATRMKMDPVKLRSKNFIKHEQLPYRNITGALFDSGNYDECLRRATELIGYNKFRQTQSDLQRESRFVGIGFSVVLEPSASHFPNSLMNGYEKATVRLDPTGCLTVLSGMTSTGTSHETVLAQIASDVLTIPYDDITVAEGDTQFTPYGFGNWASRSVVLGANAVHLACVKLRERILQTASYLVNEKIENLELQSGRVLVKSNTSKSLSLKEISYASYFMHPSIPRTISPGLEATEFFFPPTVEAVPNSDGNRNAYAAYGYSVNAAIVEVDIETGTVKILKYIVCADAGRILNPKVVEGQIVGGVCQGMGGIFLEEQPFDSDGQPLATSFMDYLLPTATDVPDITIAHMESPSPFLPLGAKGVGEGGAEGVAATVINAVEDALKPFAVRIRETPLKPEVVWRCIRGTSSAREL